MTDSASRDSATTTSIASRRELLLITILAALLTCALVVGFHGLRHDDAFISFRYGQNLSRGRGLVFNPGQRLMGSTSPAHVLASAAVHALVGDARLPSVMSALGCVEWTAASVAVYAILRAPFGAVVAGVTALAIAFGITGAETWVALETNWAVAAALWALWAASRRRYYLAAAIAALGAWLRPDAILVTVPILVLALRNRSLRALGPAATYVMLVVPWFLFAWQYFHDPLPQSLHTKAASTVALAYAEHVFTFVPAVIAPPLPGAIVWLAAIGGWIVLVRRAPIVGVVAVYGALQLGAYLAMRPGVAYTWHLQPIVVVAAVGLVGGIAELVARRLRRRASSSPSRVVFAVASLATLGLVADRTWKHASTYADETWLGERNAVYEEVAAYLVAHSAPDDLVSTEEPGTIAYHSDLPMNDRAGIVTRNPFESLRRFQAHEPTKLRWLILRKPELETAREVYGRREPTVFRRGSYRIFLFDLRAPEPSA